MLTLCLGALVGLVLALTGAGGGVLSVPLLVFALHLSLNQAGPVGLLAIALSAGIGAVFGLRDGVVRYRAAALMASFGMCAAPLGLWLAHRTANRPLALLFALILVITSTRMLLQVRNALREARPSPSFAEPRGGPCHLDSTSGRLIWTLGCARAMATAGTVSGLLSGLLGVGGGFVIVPALHIATDLPMRSIVGTSLAVIALVSIAGVTSAAVIGAMPWPIALPFALGAALGLLGGRLVTRRLAGPHLQMIFALVGLGVAALMVMRIN